MTTDVAVLGAGGRIARHVITMLADDPGVQLTLLARDIASLGPVPNGARVVAGDVLDPDTLDAVVQDQDIVYANLTGADIDDQARAVIAAMTRAGVRRLIFVVSLGIYDEVPGAFGEWNRRQIGEALKPFRRAADAIEASDLIYTLIRPAWLTDAAEIDYETTTRDQPFRGTEVSRRSVADLLAAVIRDPSRHTHANLGVDKPGSDGDRPSFLG